jgi:streptogramin lyase
LCADEEGNLWVSNQNDGTVIELDNYGYILNTITVGINPMGVAIDKSGNIWVVNEKFYHCQMLPRINLFLVHHHHLSMQQHKKTLIFNLVFSPHSFK